MMLIKSNGGSGTVSNCQFNNFMGHANAYMLDINAYWTDAALASGNGVQYTNLAFSHWHGTTTNGLTRAPIQILCPPLVPCTDIALSAIYLWTESGSSELYKCANAYGSGPCVKTGTSYTTYTTTATVTTMSGYAVTTMAGELTSGLGISKSISIPTIPASFYPSITPYSTLLG